MQRVLRIRPDWLLRLALQVACRVPEPHAAGFTLLSCYLTVIVIFFE